MQTEVINRNIIDIDDRAIPIEIILLKYLKYPEGVKYINGTRLPLTNENLIKKYNEENKTSDTPIHPLYGMQLLQESFYLYLRQTISTSEIENAESILDDNPLITKMYDNSLLTDMCIKYYPTTRGKETLHEIILDFVPNIKKDDLQQLLNLLNTNQKVIVDITKHNPYSIYNINIDNRYIVIEEEIDIRAYRFQEALKYQDYVLAVKKEYTHEC